MFNASVLGLTHEETLERLDDILAFADIGDFVDQSVKTYSSGMAMRLAFAVIAHINADILIIDEALAVGDAYFQQKCMRWLRQFRENGTVLFCGHDMGAVLGLCQRAVWLDKGETRMIGQAKEVAEAYAAFVQVKAAGLPEHVVRLRRPALQSSPASGQAERTEQYPQQKALPPKLELPPEPPRKEPVVFDWLNESSSFGSGDAEIVETRLTHPDGEPLLWLRGGEAVRLLVRARAHVDVDSPIVGFIVKDRLGQPLTGTNTMTALADMPSLRPSQFLDVEFLFQLPFLASGRYSITVALATGTLDNHIQLHWIHDAIIFDVYSPCNLGVAFALPLDRIKAAANDGAPHGELNNYAAE